MTMIPIWFFIILLVLVLLPLVALKRGPGSRRSAIHGLRHPVVRILCAVLFFATLGSTAWFTWIDHTPSASPPPTVLAPTRPPQPWPESEPYSQFDPGPCKLVVNLFLLDPRYQAVWGQSTVIRWPEDRNQPFRLSSKPAGIDCEAEFQISDFIRRGQGREVSVQGHLNLRGSYWSQSGGINGTVDQLRVETNLTGRSDIRHPLCLVPHGNESYFIAYQISRADADDPLRELAGLPSEAPEIESRHVGQIGYRRLSPDTPPGGKMFQHTGPASFILLLAAIAGAQCFRRRGIAFTALLAGMVLYAGALDFAVMRRHAARAMDDSLGAAQRLAAATQARQTFFHQSAARRLLEP